ncbi:MAG: 5-formyltetrahydrofolate cyclo-ligase [Ruminococcus sp.]|nr:5-formyltetrahydrofolate cyclo-ligase [Ruminococcus sp.]
MQSSVTDKKQLRKHFSALRDSITSPEKDRLICERLLESGRIRNADTVLLYAAFRSEVSTDLLFKGLSELGIRAAFPLCHKDGIMTFHLVNDVSELKEGSYGIQEPDMDLPQPVPTERTVCIVPGLAFTEDGGRLGYGGGFYDRFLREHPMIYTAAAAYEGQITPELPLEEHDIRLRSIYTDERKIICNAKG